MDIEGPGDFADGFSFFNEMANEGALLRPQFGRAPKRDAACLAARRPSSVRVAISARSNSAMPAKTVSTMRPAGSGVSAQGSAMDCSPACFASIVSAMRSSSDVERARRSRRVTTTTSPARSSRAGARARAASCEHRRFPPRTAFRSRPHRDGHAGWRDPGRSWTRAHTRASCVWIHSAANLIAKDAHFADILCER